MEKMLFLFTKKQHAQIKKKKKKSVPNKNLEEEHNITPLCNTNTQILHHSPF